ncbi:MAG TPA: stage II sporulation protein M [Symbiobacteriaceae bacterium]
MAGWKRWRDDLEIFLLQHRGPVVLLAAVFLVGVVFGALAVRSLDSGDKLELVTALTSAVQGLREAPPGMGWLLLKRSLLGKLKLLALLWVLGLSVVGAAGVLVVALVRGLISGFVVGFLTAEMGGAGLVLALLAHLPQSLLEVPALLVGGTASIVFSLQVIRSWRRGRRLSHFYSALSAFTGTLGLMGLVMLAAGLLESYLSPALVRLVLPWIPGF